MRIYLANSLQNQPAVLQKWGLWQISLF